MDSSPVATSMCAMVYIHHERHGTCDDDCDGTAQLQHSLYNLISFDHSAVYAGLVQERPEIARMSLNDDRA